MVKEIMIRDKAQAAKISELATHAPYEVFLSNSTMMLDARSLLGLFAMVGKKASVVVEDDVDPHSFAKLVNKMA